MGNENANKKLTTAKSCFHLRCHEKPSFYCTSKNKNNNDNTFHKTSRGTLLSVKWKNNNNNRTRSRSISRIESLFILQLPSSCHVFIVGGFRYWLQLVKTIKGNKWNSVMIFHSSCVCVCVAGERLNCQYRVLNIPN